MKISGRVVSKKPISLSRAAKLISRFAAVENGSSPAVSMYLQRSSEAFNQLVQFHSAKKSLHTDKDSESIMVESELTNLDKSKKKKRRNKKGDEAKGSKKSRVDS